MNKKELVCTISNLTNITKRDVDLILTTLLETIITTVSKGERVRLVGFGSFYPKSNLFYDNKDSIPNELLMLEKTQTAKFSVGKFFKQRIRTIRI